MPKSARPTIGKRFANFIPSNLKGLPSTYLQLPARHWTDATAIVGALPTQVLRRTSPNYALQTVLQTFDKMADLESISSQGQKYAKLCSQYAATPLFSQKFTDAFLTRRSDIETRELEKELELRANDLANESLNNAVALTGKSMKMVTETTMNKLNDIGSNSNNNNNVAEDDLNDDDYTDDVDAATSEHDGTDKCNSVENRNDDWWTKLTHSPQPMALPPPSNIKNTPEKPKMTVQDILRVRSHCHLALSCTPTSLLPKDLIAIMDQHRSDQFELKSIKSFPNVHAQMTAVLDLNMDDLPLRLWSLQKDCHTWADGEQRLFRILALSLTDFWGMCQFNRFRYDHERSFWVERIVPIFKYIGNSQKMVFSWCEDCLKSYSQSQVTPGIWKNGTSNIFADGVGRQGQIEKIIMESSSNFSTEDLGHSVGDTMKLVCSTIASLRSQIMRYMDADYATVTDYCIFSIQLIRDRLTLHKTTMADPQHWQVEELRSATVPVSWEQRYEWIKMAELIACLLMELDEQVKLDGILLKQTSQIIPVEKHQSVRHQLRSSRLLYD